ncbi:MAG TPA: ferritin, partial [Cupriavidus sp.]|nr:ferritin [Cupriavidus sp.]
MTATHPATAPGDLPWSISEIDFSSIDVAKVRNNRTLFYL